MKSQQIQDQTSEVLRRFRERRRPAHHVPALWRGCADARRIRVRGERVYFTTWSTTGKVKRLAHTSNVMLARCTRMGKPTGPSVAGTARRLDGAEAKAVSAYFGKGPWARLWNQIYRLRGWQSVTFEVAPADMSAQS